MLQVGFTTSNVSTPNPVVVDPRTYDVCLVAFSAGKDSIACFLHLLEVGVPIERIELWHHDVDGHGASSLMDWPSTPAYCRAFAKAFKVPLYFSWRVGGFEREMLRQDTPTAPVCWELPGGKMGTSGGKGPRGTRRQFPQVSADLSIRWCSAYLKVDVCSMAIRNQARFNRGRTLVISGERAEESPCRARYKEFERDRTDTDSRTVHHGRPVHKWTEQQVWDCLKRHGVNPHPAYHLGWSRLSCRACIFGNKDQWASLERIDPQGFKVIADYERKFGKTIHRTKSVGRLASEGTPYPETTNQEMLRQAMDPNWAGDIKIPIDLWQLPAGAFRGSGGPS